jgi:cobalt-zinc-cadmium efflux system protein
MSNSTHVDSSEKRLALALLLTALILIAQIIGGIFTGSLALLSDAAHIFLDMLALAMSYGAIRLAAIPANNQHTFGFYRVKILAALINGISLFIIVFEILREALERLQNPQEVLVGPMLIVAVVGLIVNLIVMRLLHDHDHDDLNTRSAFLHVLGDTLSSVGVIGGGLIIWLTGWYWIDPLISVFIAVILLIGSGRVLRESIHVLMEGVPSGLDVDLVKSSMASVSGIQNIHDLHVWSIVPGYKMLSAHVVMNDQPLSQTGQIIQTLNHQLTEQFGIQHTTIQFECENCGQGSPVCSMDASSEAEGHLNHE